MQTEPEQPETSSTTASPVPAHPAINPYSSPAQVSPISPQSKQELKHTVFAKVSFCVSLFSILIIVGAVTYIFFVTTSHLASSTNPESDIAADNMEAFLESSHHIMIGGLGIILGGIGTFIGLILNIVCLCSGLSKRLLPILGTIFSSVVLAVTILLMIIGTRA